MNHAPRTQGQIRSLILDMIALVKDRSKVLATELTWKYSCECSYCDNRNINARMSEFFEKMINPISISKENLSFPMKLNCICRKGKLTPSYTPIPKIYYLGFPNLPKMNAIKCNIAKGNTKIKSMLQGKPIYHTTYCLIFANGSNYACSVFFSGHDYYIMTNQVLQDDSRFQMFRNETELISIFYQYGNNPNSAVGNFFADLEDYQYKTTNAQPLVKDNQTKPATVIPANLIKGNALPLLVVPDMPEDLGDEPSIGVQSITDLSSDLDYIDKAFMLSYTRCIRLTYSRITNPFVKMNKKCKPCSNCGTYNSKLLNNCYACTNSLDLAGVINEIEN